MGWGFVCGVGVGFRYGMGFTCVGVGVGFRYGFEFTCAG